MSEHTPEEMTTTSGSGLKTWHLAIVAMIGLTCIGAVAYALRGSKEKSTSNLEAEFSSTLNNRNFRAFKARPAVKQAKKKRIIKRKKPEDEMSAEERAAWKLAESTGQDVVYEDHGEDPVEKSAAVASKKKSTSLLPNNGPRQPFKEIDDRRRTKRYGATDKQRDMLRALNQKINERPQELKALKVDSKANRRLMMGLPYKLKPIKRLPINPNPPSWTPPKVKSKTFLPDVYGDGPMPVEGSTAGTE